MRKRMENDYMKYKLIACDLDGTLLDKEAKLSKENYAAITELSKYGVLFVPTTGRSFYEAPSYVREHPSIRYFISSNGAVVQDLKKGIIFQTLIPKEKVIKINKIAQKCKLMCTNHRDNCTFTQKELVNEASMKEYNISHYFKNQIYTCTKPIENYFEEFASGEPCEMLGGCFKTVEDKMRFFDAIKELDTLRITATGNCFEIVSGLAGKGNGVKRLIDFLGIDADDIITIGDGDNDMDMIKLTCNSIAVSNASEALKSAAGHVGCSNNENIIEYVLNNFIKK